MALKLTNTAYGTLASSITSGATTIVLNAGDGTRFPVLGASDWTWGTLSDAANNTEVVKITALSTDTFTVLRGQDNTLPRAFAAGDRLDLRPCAAAMNDKLDAAVAATIYATTAALNTALAAKLDIATATSTYAQLAGGNVFSGVQQITAQRGKVVSLGNVSGAVTIDLTLGTTYSATIIGATTFSFTGAPAAGWDTQVYLKLVNAGSFSTTFVAGTQFPSGAAPTFTATGRDLLAVWYDVEQTKYVVGKAWADYK